MSKHVPEDKQVILLNMDSTGQEKTASEPEKKGRILWADSVNQQLEVHHYSDRLHYSQTETDAADEEIVSDHNNHGNVPPAHSKCCCCIIS